MENPEIKRVELPADLREVSSNIAVFDAQIAADQTKPLVIFLADEIIDEGATMTTTVRLQLEEYAGERPVFILPTSLVKRHHGRWSYELPSGISVPGLHAFTFDGELWGLGWGMDLGGDWDAVLRVGADSKYLNMIVWGQLHGYKGFTDLGDDAQWEGYLKQFFGLSVAAYDDQLARWFQSEAMARQPMTRLDQ